MNNISVSEALAAALAATNEWLGEQQRGYLSMRLEDSGSIQEVLRSFKTRAPGVSRVYWWNWERKFHRHVKYGRGWFTSLRRDGRAVALCVGTICGRRSHVAIEYLERRRYAHGVKGYALLSSYQFMLVAARLLQVPEVRINQPVNEKLVQYYARTLTMTRHPVSGPVQYLSRSL